MRAPSNLIPTENSAISIGLGALLPVLMLVIASFSEAVFYCAVILAPFASGFSSSIIFGTGSPDGIGPCLVRSMAAAAGFYVLLVGVAYATLMVPIAGLVYLSLILFPFSILVIALLSGLGAIYGRLAAAALGR